MQAEYDDPGAQWVRGLECRSSSSVPCEATFCVTARGTPLGCDMSDAMCQLNFQALMLQLQTAANSVLNYEKRAVSCNLKTLKKNGITVGLDEASLIADAFGPEEQYAKLAVGLTLSSAQTINSAANHDVTGKGLGMGSYLRAPTELAAKSAGWGWAKWIPYAGASADVYSAYRDISLGISENNSCMMGQ